MASRLCWGALTCNSVVVVVVIVHDRRRFVRENSSVSAGCMESEGDDSVGSTRGCVGLSSEEELELVNAEEISSRSIEEPLLADLGFSNSCIFFSRTAILF